MRPIDADKLFDDLLRMWGTEVDVWIADMLMKTVNAAPTIAPPPNDPLTLEELREMDGEPVWCIIIDGYNKGESFWGLVSIDTAECICNNWDVILFAYYGKTWLAYRRKPEEGTT